MPKRKRGKSFANFTLVELLEALHHFRIPEKCRLTSIVLFGLKGEVTVEKLSRYTGLKVSVLKEYHLLALEQYGFLKVFDGKYQVVIPPVENWVEPKTKEAEIEPVKRLTGKAKDLIIEYRKLWIAKYHRKCVVNGQEKTKALKLVGELGYDEALQRLQNYMSHEDPWIAERAYAFSIFYKLVNRYATGCFNGRKAKTEIVKHGSEFDSEVREFEERERLESNRGNEE